MITLSRGDSLLLRAKVQTPDGRLLKPGLDTAVRVLAWGPGSDPHADEPSCEAPCEWNAARRQWVTAMHTAGWELGPWRLRADAAGFDARGMAWIEVEITP